jgi:hypothetical protein
MSFGGESLLASTQIKLTGLADEMFRRIAGDTCIDGMYQSI